LGETLIQADASDCKRLVSDHLGSPRIILGKSGSLADVKRRVVLNPRPDQPIRRLIRPHSARRRARPSEHLRLSKGKWKCPARRNRFGIASSGWRDRCDNSD
jgi:hypothetical protein